jgi:excisionase family DNA binding protein
MPKDDIKLPELLTIAQVAKILNVHATTLRRWDKKGKLKAIRVGTRRGVGACPPLEIWFDLSPKLV